MKKKNKSKAHDYNSPYAEYLLHRFDNSKSENVSLSKPTKRQESLTEEKLNDIRSAYNQSVLHRGNTFKNNGRAQSPITTAMMMIHPRNVSKRDLEQATTLMNQQDTSFGVNDVIQPKS